MSQVSLWTAAREGDIAFVREHLRTHPDAHADRNDEGCTPLHYAALGGSLDVVEALLTAGADPDARTDAEHTPSYYAAFGGHVAVFRRLRTAGADVRTVDAVAATLLHAAAAGGSLEIVDELLAAELDPNASNLYRELPLHRAAQADRLDVVQRLAALATDRNPVDAYATTLLHKAANRDAVDTATWLIQQGLDPTAGDLAGDTPLHIAATFGREHMLALLLDCGVDIDVRNSTGATPLIAASAAGQTTIVECLIARGADITVVDHVGQGPLHVAAARGHATIIEQLVAGGASEKATDANGHRPRELAALYGRTEAWDALRGAAPPFAPSDVRNLVSHRVGRGEMRIWYLGHSGWAVRTAKHLFLIDYAPGTADSEEDTLLNGRVTPSEWGDANVFVLVTHAHGDHFDRRVLEWRHPSLHRVYGWDAPEAWPGFRMEDREIKTIGDVVIAAIPSTDSGSAFLIEADGVSFYHASDHAAEGVPPSAEFLEGVEWLADAFAPIQAAFLPVFGCGLPRPDVLRAGNAATIERLRPAAVFPMHVGWTSHFYHEFERWARDSELPVDVGVAQHPGDRFRLRNGRLERVWTS
jgi:ankyrin repeat protein/L-ascorbate metabolism protein UlaG (beta-lactamase superfamily)